jgi:hypothetical protein
LTAGCKATRVSHNTVYLWRELDEAFAMAENQARSTFADTLEEEVVRRARDGYDRPVYQGGELVGHERVNSDNLLWRLLQAVRPEKYRDPPLPATYVPIGIASRSLHGRPHQHPPPPNERPRDLALEILHRRWAWFRRQCPPRLDGTGHPVPSSGITCALRSAPTD